MSDTPAQQRALFVTISSLGEIRIDESAATNQGLIKCFDVILPTKASLSSPREARAPTITAGSGYWRHSKVAQMHISRCNIHCQCEHQIPRTSAHREQSWEVHFLLAEAGAATQVHYLTNVTNVSYKC